MERFTKAIAILSLTIALIGMTISAPAMAIASPINQNEQVQEASMHPEDIRTAIRRAAKAWETGDADAFAVMFTPDGEFIVPGKRWQGAAAIREQLAKLGRSNSDVSIDIRRIIVEGNQAVVEWRWEETEKATGSRSQADDSIVVDFMDGKISRWREYIDSETPASSQ